MRALAFPFDEEGNLYCCKCAEQIMAEPGFLKHLYLATTQLRKVDGADKCLRCGHEYGGHDALCAAGRIAQNLWR